MPFPYFGSITIIFGMFSTILNCFGKLLFLYQYVAASRPCSKSDASFMIKMSDEELQQTYSPYDYCVLQNPDDRSVCSRLLSDSWCSVTHPLKTIPDVLYQRPFLYESKHLKADSSPVMDLVIKMNRTNKVLVIAGDSVSREYVKSLFCELYRHNNKVAIAPSKNLLRKIHEIPRSGFRHYHITVPIGRSSVTLQVVYHYITKRFTSTNDFSRMRYTIARTVWHKQPGTSVVLLFNIGLHEQDSENYALALSTVFNWATGQKFQGFPGKQNVFIYRETTPQDYPDSMNGEIDIIKHRQWLDSELPLPVCTSYACHPALRLVNQTAYEPSMEWRHMIEQKMIQASIVNSVQNLNRFQISFIPFNHYARHFYQMHPAAGFKNIVRNNNKSNITYIRQKIDCTHYEYTPMMHLPVFAAISSLCCK